MHKVLLIEDNRMVKIVHERMLTKAGYQVVSATDGEEALRLACQISPDVVLLDMLLPKISGPQVLRSLKSDPATAHVPVIVVTGLSQKNEDRLLRDGADAFIEKADLVSSVEPLVHMIQRVLRERRAPAPLPMAASDALSWTSAEIESTAAPDFVPPPVEEKTIPRNLTTH